MQRVCFIFIKTNYKTVIQYLITSFTILFVGYVNKYKIILLVKLHGHHMIH